MLVPSPRRALLALLVGVLALGAPSPALAQTPPPSTPFTTPNTDACPYATTPAPPTDASEVPAPGATSPAPLPVADPPAGGLGSCGTTTPAGAPALPEGISSAGFVVADLDSGEVLAAKDPHGRYRPASTIKLLTASLALTRLDLDTVVTGTQADADTEGSEVGVGPGGRYTVRELLLGLLLASGNDAAHALAEQLGGVAETVEAANDLAESLGATDTRVVTPSGLDAPGTSTSPYDLALFYRHALSLPGFAELNLTRSLQFPGYAEKPGFQVDNDNQLIQQYPGAIGGKNGFTDDARQTFVGAGERDGRRLVVTLTQGERLPLLPWQQAAALLDWGFALPAGTAGVGTLAGTAAGAAPSGAATSTPTVTATPAPAGPGQLAAPAADGADGGGGDGSTVAALLAAGAAVLLGLAAVLLVRRRRRLG